MENSMPRRFLLFDHRLGDRANPDARAKGQSHGSDPSISRGRTLRTVGRRTWSRLKKLLDRFRSDCGKDWPTDREEFFSHAIWRGAHDLRESLGLKEPDFRMVAGYSHLDAKAFYLYAVLDEIQKTGVAIRQWMEFLEDPGDGVEFNPEDQVHRMILESVLDEQDFRKRKLLEVLVDLVCFRRTNEQDYYRHYMLLQELRSSLTVQEDFRRFYGFTSRRLAANMEPEIEWVQQLEGGAIDLAKCWYLRHPRRLGNNPQPGQLFSSFRRRLTLALSEATEAEKLVLGLSYYSYSQTSSGIHFQVLRQRFSNWLEEGRIDISRIGVLALNVLAACQELLGDVPDGINRQAREVLEDSEEIVDMFESAVGRRAIQGSFVLAYGEKLAEVIDTKSSEFGYESYRVRFLEDSAPLGIEDDWLPPQEVRRLYDLDGLAEDVRTELVKGGVPPNELDESSIRKAVRQGMIESWEAGLRDVVLRRLRRRD